MMTRPPLNRDSIEEAADVAVDYETLQGLTTVGLGAALVVLAATGNIALGTIGMALSAVVGPTYYYRRYGRASMPRSAVLLSVLLSIVAVVLVFCGLVADHFVQGPVALGALVCAVVLTALFPLGYRRVRPTRWHWIAVGALALSGLVPLTGWPADPVLWRYSLITIGPALILIGCVDHLRLRRALTPIGDGPGAAGASTADTDG